jgi:hypothetical protein
MMGGEGVVTDLLMPVITDRDGCLWCPADEQ